MSLPTAKATGQQPILLIEDEPSVIAFLRAALERKGYAVVDAASGAEGLQRLSNGQFAGVISDIRMPGTVNGAEVHAWIQKNRPELKTRIILMSDETKTRLLVVDDEQSIRRLCMTIRNTLGYACSEAETAEAALARLESEAPDLI